MPSKGYARTHPRAGGAPKDEGWGPGPSLNEGVTA